jgi:hypothetical protein
MNGSHSRLAFSVGDSLFGKSNCLFAPVPTQKSPVPTGRVSLFRRDRELPRTGLIGRANFAWRSTRQRRICKFAC